jgi:hypothetical protein
MPAYNVVTTTPTFGPGPDGNGTVEFPVGTVVNRIIWDGETEYEPGEGLALEPAD